VEHQRSQEFSTSGFAGLKTMNIDELESYYRHAKVYSFVLSGVNVAI